MKQQILHPITVSVLLFICINFAACSKSDTTPSPNDPCAGKNISIGITPISSTTCDNTGSIDALATGSTNFSYKLNSTGVYQASGSFTKLAAGDYIIFAKDGAGCEKSTNVTIASVGTAGALFTAVKSLVAAKCQSCHNNVTANGGMNFQVECNIVKNKGRIKVRAVDEGTMPQSGPLPQSEKDIISNWITAGGAYTN